MLSVFGMIILYVFTMYLFPKKEDYYNGISIHERNVN